MEKYSQVVFDLYGSAQECTPGEFIEHAMHLTRGLLRFDSGTVIRSQFSDAGQMAVQAMHAYRQPVEKLRDRRDFLYPDPTLVQAFKARGHSVSASLESLDQRKYDDVIRYARKYEVAQTLVYISGAPLSHGLDVVALWRSHSKRAYSAADTVMGNLILPHLFQSRQINSRLAGATQHQHGGLLLVSDSDGCLQFFDDDACRMLQAEWPQWTPPMLPPAFFRALREAGDARYVGRTFTAGMTAQGRHLHIVLEQKTQRARLAPAELKVAQLAAAGASYKEIAAQLGISPATVRNQLHKVYAKLKVANKTALAHALHTVAPDGPA